MASKNTEREAREARERLRRYTARQTVHAQQISRRRRDNLFAIGGVVVVAALATVTQIFYFNGGPGTPTPAPSFTAETPAPTGQNVGDIPDPSVAEGRIWTGTIALNDIPVTFELDGSLAPQAVASFVTSTQDGYYDGKTCHRLVEGPTAGLIQCGSLDGAGGPDADYSFGPIENAPADGVYPSGTIAMARVSGDAYSNGHQFFIVFGEATLPADAVGGYTVIGHVTGNGIDQVIAQIANAGIVGGGQDGAPVVPTTITSLTIQ